MARSLSSDLQHEVKVIYLNTNGIKKTAREANVSRNASIKNDGVFVETG